MHAKKDSLKLLTPFCNNEWQEFTLNPRKAAMSHERERERNRASISSPFLHCAVQLGRARANEERRINRTDVWLDAWSSQSLSLQNPKYVCTNRPISFRLKDPREGLVYFCPIIFLSLSLSLSLFTQSYNPIKFHNKDHENDANGNLVNPFITCSTQIFIYTIRSCE